MTNTTKEIVQGSRLEVLKGMRDAWDVKNGSYFTIETRQIWTVESLTQNPEDGTMSLLLSRQFRRARFQVSTAGKLKAAEVNMNTGDPTRKIRVCCL